MQQNSEKPIHYCVYTTRQAIVSGDQAIEHRLSKDLNLLQEVDVLRGCA